MTYASRPERKGYRLTEEGEQSYQNWLDLGGCICFTGCAPCHVCVDEGHPISLEETDEVWEPDTKFKKGDEVVCVSTSIARVKVGERFIVENVRPELTTPSFHPELVHIKVDGIIRNYSPKHFELVKEGGNDVSRSDVINVKEGVVPSGYTWKDPLNTYGQYINSGWTNEQLIASNILQPMDTPYSMDKIESVKIDRDGKIEVRLEGYIVPKTADVIINVSKQTEEKQTMPQTNRRVVNVKLLDNDSGLPVEYALVAQFQGIVTEDSDEVVKQEILLNKDIANAIAKHNEKRIEQTDLEILKRTGNDVKLRQVKLKDLTWVVTTA